MVSVKVHKGHVNGDSSKKIISFEALNGRVFQTEFKSFAMMTVAWSDDVFVWGSPEGHFAGCSWKENRLLFDLKPAHWFNVMDLAWSREGDSFYGLASDWGGGSDYGLFLLNAESGEIELIKRLSNEIGHAHAFIKNGEYVVFSNGTMLCSRTGEIVKKLDFLGLRAE
jgi:hypothetical protein